MNRFAWDLRYDDPVQTPGAFYYGGGPRGALALPGDYQVSLTANGKSQTVPLRLAIDPRLKGAEEGMRKIVRSLRQGQRALLAAASGDQRNSRNKIANRIARTNGSRITNASSRRSHAADEMEKKMSAIEEKLIQVKHEKFGRKPRLSESC